MSEGYLGMSTDIGNTNFVGAGNPDAVLNVQFYMRAVKNEFRSLPENENRPIFEDRLFIKIWTPGNDKNIIDTYAYDKDKQRFPLQWAQFQASHDSNQQMVGTPLAQWPLLGLSQVEELRALKFHTVENIALSGDDHIAKIGMAAGMAPTALRDAAKRFLSVAKGSAEANRTAEELKKRDAEIEAMKAQHAKDMEEMRALIAAGAPKKRGRKPKEAQA